MTGTRGPAGTQGLRRFVRPGEGAPPAPVPAEPAPPESGPSESAAPSAAAAPVALPGIGGSAASPDAERCELCSAEVPAEHGHVADLESSTLVCACRACYLLFTQANTGRGRYRAVPDRYLSDPGRTLTAAQWDQLEIPVGLAFFLRSSSADRVAGFYPSPAGVTECILDLAAWEQLTREYPLLGEPAPDVEAALVCRTDAGVEYFLVPIDACYELAGRMRLHWRGFDGGAEARASIADFLDKVRSRARALRPPASQEA
jgi:Family of unknown function (DUF5947)